MCFDIASSYYHDPLSGYLNNPEQAREYFKDKEQFRFHAATAFVYGSNQPYDFENYRDLVKFLIEAEEIITFNGRTCEFVVLESLVGAEHSRKLWEKTHHDLKGWAAHSLEDSIAMKAPALKCAYKSEYYDSRYIELSSAKDDFVRRQLAGTYRDAKCTLELFRAYQSSGDTAYTFDDRAGC